MNMYDQYRQSRIPVSVGTGGGEGGMKGPCACPRRHPIRLDFVTQMNHVATRTGTRPPPYHIIYPLSLQMENDVSRHAPFLIRLSTSIRERTSTNPAFAQTPGSSPRRPGRSSRNSLLR